MPYDATAEFDRIRREVGILETAQPDRAVKVRLARTSGSRSRTEEAVLFRITLRYVAREPELWVVLADARLGLAFERRWSPADMELANGGIRRAGVWPRVDFVDAR
ncbi:hypothetical protein [Burkholderia glumae]|uniref:Uncharacterized protein n=2 Tax=Burkholderia glumae TaxID=337 RepID=A0ABY5BBW7_BURGL|nr:hypothetical protein [Burkholderia glumae]QGA41648.1 hypothetical protein GAS19_29625 [Burkholderia glumae]QHP94774.1 hypothetical protein EXE55_28040 [Burkholderia glumae]QKM51647.1 hypothetical protein B7760_05724 [Burkholderia glumae]USS44422.1 hypothetical protein NFI99_14225 [Burkholderia glumae]